jgi:flagellar basal-body rod protein FlgB
MFKNQLFTVLERSLDLSSARHTAISSNIANENTPGYKRLDVIFQKALSDAMGAKTELKRTNPKHIPLNNSLDKDSIVTFSRENNSTIRNDGNNVDIDYETAALAENNLYFNGLAHLLSVQIQLLRQAISEGRG